jgi:IS5 family transposase
MLDETTILNFRHLLEKQQLTEKLLEIINAHLKEQGLLVSQGTMVDATIIHAPSSTKNKDKARDPKRPAMVFWHENPYRRRYQFRRFGQPEKAQPQTVLGSSSRSG